MSKTLTHAAGIAAGRQNVFALFRLLSVNVGSINMLRLIACVCFLFRPLQHHRTLTGLVREDIKTGPFHATGHGCRAVCVEDSCKIVSTVISRQKKKSQNRFLFFIFFSFFQKLQLLF
jgi:hypothetical protein